MKVCPTCQEMKPVDGFYKKGRHRDCIQCLRARARERYKANRTQHLARLKEKNKLPYHKELSAKRSLAFYNSIPGRARTLLAGAQRRARKREEPCTLTLEYIIAQLEYGRCQITGLPFEMRNRHAENRSRKNPYSPSLDRIDSTKPYTNENSRVVIWQYNLMKGELTDVELKYLCAVVLRSL